MKRGWDPGPGRWRGGDRGTAGKGRPSTERGGSREGPSTRG